MPRAVVDRRVGDALWMVSVHFRLLEEYVVAGFITKGQLAEIHRERSTYLDEQKAKREQRNVARRKS